MEMYSYPFEPTQTLLSQQSYSGSHRLIILNDIRKINPANGRPYTIRRAQCPNCEATGEIKDFHGTNCFYDCCECGQALKS